MALCLWWHGVAMAESEILVPDGTGSPDQWVASDAGSKVTAVTDGTDGLYIIETTDEENQMYTMSDATGIDGADTIDSVRILCRAQDNGSGNNKLQMVLFTDASNFCLGADRALGTSFAEFNDAFQSGAPSGSDACAGAWTLAKLNAIQIRVDATAIGGSRELDVSDIDLIVFYTPAGAGGNLTHRRRSL